MEIIFIGIGGFIGAVARHYVGNLVHDSLKIDNFPVGILIVNILGCLIIGLLSGFVETKDFLTNNLKSLVFIGLLGSFTTFSTFSNDTFKLITEGQIFSAIINIVISVSVGLIFVWLGYLLAKQF